MYKYFFLLFAIFGGRQLLAHPMPSSVVNLSVLESSVSGEAKMPLVELESAVGLPMSDSVNLNSAFFQDYFYKHIQAASGNNKWTTTIEKLELTSDIDANVGKYQQVLVHFTLTPPDANYVRQFAFNYDAIVHQVVTHKILVFVTEDWSNGIHADDNARQLGIIKTDFVNGKLLPLQVDIEPGSWWKGFSSMVDLGMEHIKEGTDHLLFLLVLLLPSMLLVKGKRWGNFGGIRYSLTRLLKITTAFTIGHSVTLLIGALDWIRLPSQPVEIMIAVSILVSAVHAIRPIFPGKEIYVAAGFGLIHGLAFASALSSMNLGAATLALSIFGFNLGIEMMQLFIIAMIVPWLLLLSQTNIYRWFRVLGAALAGIAALGWIVERTSGQTNFIADFTINVYLYATWIVIALTVISLTAYICNKNSFKHKLFTTAVKVFRIR